MHPAYHQLSKNAQTNHDSSIATNAWQRMDSEGCSQLLLLVSPHVVDWALFQSSGLIDCSTDCSTMSKSLSGRTRELRVGPFGLIMLFCVNLIYLPYFPGVWVGNPVIKAPQGENSWVKVSGYLEPCLHQSRLRGVDIWQRTFEVGPRLLQTVTAAVLTQVELYSYLLYLWTVRAVLAHECLEVWA